MEIKLEIRKDYQHYISIKKLKTIMINNMKHFAEKTSFNLSARNAIDKMLDYNLKIANIDSEIEEFEILISQFSYEEEKMIDDIFEFTTHELSEIWKCSSRTVSRRISALNKKYKGLKYGKIDK